MALNPKIGPFSDFPETCLTVPNYVHKFTFTVLISNTSVAKQMFIFGNRPSATQIKT